jgi:hypothetical protein
MSTTEAEAIDAPVEQKSRFEDCIDVFFSPSELFERRKNDKFGPPLIILLVLAVAFYYILLPAAGMILRTAMPPEQLAKMGGMMKVMSIVGGITVPIQYLIMIAITALIFFGLARLVDAQPTYSEMMLVATYGGYIFLIGTVASMVAVLIHGEAGLDPVKHLSFGVLRFVDPKTMPKAVAAIAARIDLFKIWQAVVWAIGFRIVTGVDRGKATMVSGATWLLFAVPSMLGPGIGAKPAVQIKTGN